MTDEEIAVALNGHEHEIGSLKHRMKDQEEQSKVVKELALNMKNMIAEQEKQGRRLQALENEPAERWNSAKKTAFTTIVSVIAGALATGLIVMLAQYI